MRSKRNDGRVLIYSHDTFGLGHLRRCRTIAHSLVENFKQLSVLILSGSPIIGSFDFRARVDFVRVPGVIKLRNGEYTSLNLHLDVRETMSMRASIIQHTAEEFAPDVFIVDKEPVGLRGELLQTLKVLKRRGTRLILGLRDVMDEPRLLEPEWQRKKVVPALREFYDEIWVYGLPQICDPLEGIALPESVRRRMVYTGYLHRGRRRRRGPDRLGAARLRARSAASVSRAPRARTLHAVRAAGGVHGPRGEVEARRRHHFPWPARTPGGSRRRRGRHGRVQHLLRGDLAQQARAHRAAHRAAPRAVHSRVARCRDRPGEHAERRWRP